MAGRTRLDAQASKATVVVVVVVKDLQDGQTRLKVPAAAPVSSRQQTQKVRAAFATYLELAPTGAGAAYVKEQLQRL
jgi:ribosomal protein L18E